MIHHLHLRPGRTKPPNSAWQLRPFPVPDHEPRFRRWFRWFHPPKPNQTLAIPTAFRSPHSAAEAPAGAQPWCETPRSAPGEEVAVWGSCHVRQNWRRLSVFWHMARRHAAVWVCVGLAWHFFPPKTTLHETAWHKNHAQQIRPSRSPRHEMCWACASCRHSSGQRT